MLNSLKYALRPNYSDERQRKVMNDIVFNRYYFLFIVIISDSV